MKIYTRTGDTGQTSLAGGQRVSKCCARLESYGTVDELNSHIGLLISMIDGCAEKQNPICIHTGKFLVQIQSALFTVGGYLATDTSQQAPKAGTVMTQEMVMAIEHEIDLLQEVLLPLHSFILPGGTPAACQAHVCRTVCRRTERSILRLRESGTKIDELVLSYVNRLSDYFFMLARVMNKVAGVNDVEWKI